MSNRFLNSYFGFNKQQRNGLFVLICISFFLLLVRVTYPYLIKPDNIKIHNLSMIERVLDSTVDSQNRHSEIKDLSEKTKHSLFIFDPNTVNQKQLLELGFSSKTASVFIKYRNKGFVFKQKTDLKKVYGVSDKLYSQLEPFISIQTADADEKKSKIIATTKSENTSAKGLQSTFELNNVDSIGLLSINGIGTTYAKRIIKYRELLGGYVTIEQLKEVYGFNDELYLKVKEHFTVNASNIKKMNLNTDDFKVINKHPYITYEMCKTIFDWRKKTSITATNLKDILKDEILYQKLMPYLKFD